MKIGRPYQDSELVIALVAQTGTDVARVSGSLKKLLKEPYSYNTEELKLTDLIRREPYADLIPADDDRLDSIGRVNAKMDAGNELRRRLGRLEALAMLAVDSISTARPPIGAAPSGNTTQHPSRKRLAYIVNQLKRPEEVRLLRNVYGPGFFLIGVHSTYEARLKALQLQGFKHERIISTFQRDLHEQGVLHGQRTRDTFALADAYLSLDATSRGLDEDIRMFLDVIFGDPHATPTRDEYCMFLAYAASFRSADLSRQVGAVLVSSMGDITATGANEVPAPGGGQYYRDMPNKWTDADWGWDWNQVRRQKLFEEVASRCDVCIHNIAGSRVQNRNSRGYHDLIVEILRDSDLSAITEYGRPVHAEMEAILSCGRAGISTRGGTLYTTTFPCHNCAKHIVDAGIQKVVFVEPYPKSLASVLYPDSIHVVGDMPPKDVPEHCPTTNRVGF